MRSQEGFHCTGGFRGSGTGSSAAFTQRTGATVALGCLLYTSDAADETSTV